MANNYGPDNQGYKSGGGTNPQQQGYNANPQQNYSANPQQNYNPQQQNYGANPQRQGYGTNPQPNYNPQQQGYGTNPQQGYNANPQQGYNANPQRQGYNANPQQNYNPQQQGYGANPQQNYQNVGQRGSVSGYPAVQQNAQSGAGAKAVKKPKGKSNTKLIIIIAAAAVVVIAAIVVVILFATGVFGGGGSGTYENTYIMGAVTEDGTAYIPLMDGDALKINDEVVTAAMTPDRKHVVVCLEDGTLYVTDGSLENRDTVSDICDDFAGLYDEGFIYVETESGGEDDYNAVNTYYLYTFEDGVSIELDENIYNGVFADNSLAMLYTTENGVYSIVAGWEEPEKVGSYDSSVSLVGISDDANIAVWTAAKDDGGYSLILYEGDDKETLASYDDSYYGYGIYATFSKDQNLLVIANTDSDELFIKEPGEEAIKVRLGGSVSYSSIYTNAGVLSRCSANEVTGLYVTVSSNDSDNLYYIDMDGEKERVLSGVDSYYIADKYIVYLDEDETLYYGTLNGASVENETKIAGEVCDLVSSDSSKYVYYFRNYSYSSMADLYVFEFNSGEASKVGSDVYIYNTSLDTTGGKLYYLTDTESVGSGWDTIGTMYVYDAKKGEKQKISSDVYCDYPLISSGLEYSRVNSSSLIYKKYSSDDNGTVCFDWYYYDGSSGTKFASDLCE